MGAAVKGAILLDTVAATSTRATLGTTEAAMAGQVLLEMVERQPESLVTFLADRLGRKEKIGRTLVVQLGDRIAGPQKPRQTKFVWSRFADQRDDLLLLRFGKGRLLARSSALFDLVPNLTLAAVLVAGAVAAATGHLTAGELVAAALPVAFDPAVHRVGMHPEHPRGLGLGHVVQHRLDGTFAQCCLRCAWQ